MSRQNDQYLAFDRASVRTVDENGYLHVGSSHITKATVNPYYGREIPGGVEHGYMPDSVYWGLRDPEELKRSLPTWAGIPLHAMHHMDSAENPQKQTRVGSVGTEIVWNDPYVDAPLTVWDAGAIEAIENGSLRELSCAYRYDPEFTAGEWEGKPYDFVMRNLRGNHVALVEEGRAGPDVLVADRNTVTGADMEETTIVQPAVEEQAAPAVAEAAPETAEQEVDLAQAIIDLHKFDPATGELVHADEDDVRAGELKAALGELAGAVPPEKLIRIVNAMKGLMLLKQAEAEAPADAVPPETSEVAVEVEAPAEEPAPEAPNRAEEFRQAMDKCGLDGANPEVVKAFMEGVLYGEHAKEGDAAPAEQAPEQAGTPVEFTETTTSVIPDASCAQDADTIRADAVKATKLAMRELFKAVEAVRPVAGNLDPTAFDSAEDVYGEALKARGYALDAYPREAWRAMVDVVLRERAPEKTAPMAAQPCAEVRLEGPFAGLKRISIG